MNVLLTGATGFLGSHLARALVLRGDRVLAYRRPSSRLDRLADVAQEIHWLQTSLDRLEAPFLGDKIDGVIHAATIYGRQNESSIEMLEANVVFPAALAELASRHHLRCFLNTDTFFNLPETRSQNLPRYIRCKAQLLEWLKDFAGNLSIYNLRLEHIYGPADNPEKFVPSTVAALRANVPRLALTHGEQRRDFLHVADVVEAFLRCLDHAPDRPLPEIVQVGVGTGKSIALRQFVETTHRIFNSSTALSFGDRPYIAGELMDSKADPSYLEALGWQPRVTLEDGIRSLMPTD